MNSKATEEGKVAVQLLKRKRGRPRKVVPKEAFVTVSENSALQTQTNNQNRNKNIQVCQAILSDQGVKGNKSNEESFVQDSKESIISNKTVNSDINCCILSNNSENFNKNLIEETVGIDKNVRTLIENETPDQIYSKIMDIKRNEIPLKSSDVAEQIITEEKNLKVSSSSEESDQILDRVSTSSSSVVIEDQSWKTEFKRGKVSHKTMFSKQIENRKSKKQKGGKKKIILGNFKLLPTSSSEEDIASCKSNCFSTPSENSTTKLRTNEVRKRGIKELNNSHTNYCVDSSSETNLRESVADEENETFQSSKSIFLAKENYDVESKISKNKLNTDITSVKIVSVTDLTSNSKEIIVKGVNSKKTSCHNEAKIEELHVIDIHRNKKKIEKSNFDFPQYNESSFKASVEGENVIHKENSRKEGEDLNSLEKNKSLEITPSCDLKTNEEPGSKINQEVEDSDNKECEEVFSKKRLFFEDNLNFSQLLRKIEKLKYTSKDSLAIEQEKIANKSKDLIIPKERFFCTTSKEEGNREKQKDICEEFNNTFNNTEKTNGCYENDYFKLQNHADGNSESDVEGNLIIVENEILESNSNSSDGSAVKLQNLTTLSKQKNEGKFLNSFLKCCEL